MRIDASFVKLRLDLTSLCFLSARTATDRFASTAPGRQPSPAPRGSCGPFLTGYHGCLEATEPMILRPRLD